MKYKMIVPVIAFAIFISCQAYSQELVFKFESNNSFSVTLDKLKVAISEKGLSVFSIIDHQKGAHEAGLELPPTTVIMFGNPKIGTLLMHCDQQMGLKLPLKILVVQDKRDEVFVSYENPYELYSDFNLEECSEMLEKVNSVLADLAEKSIS